MVLHDMAIDARLWVVAEVACAVAVTKRERTYTSQHAQAGRKGEGAFAKSPLRSRWQWSRTFHNFRWHTIFGFVIDHHRFLSYASSCCECF